MANVQVARGLRWEAGDDLTLFRILKAKSESCSRFIRAGFVGFGCCEAGECDLSRIKTLDVGDPPENMNVLLPILEQPSDFPCN